MNSRLRRGAYTLLEMTTIMPVIIMLLVMSISWMHETMKYTSKVKGYQQQHRQAFRLTKKFRDDVNLGQSIRLLKDRLTIVHPDKSETNYVIDSNQVLVETISTGRVLARDAFEFPKSTKLSWDDEGLPNWIGLVGHELPRKTNPANATGERSSASETTTDLPAKFFVRAGVQRYLNASLSGVPSTQTEIEATK